MIGERLVDGGAMSVAQRYRERIRRKAFPQQFNEPKPVFCREFQNLGKVRVAHGSGANRRVPVSRGREPGVRLDAKIASQAICRMMLGFLRTAFPPAALRR